MAERNSDVLKEEVGFGRMKPIWNGGEQEDHGTMQSSDFQTFPPHGTRKPIAEMLWHIQNISFAHQTKK